MEIARALNERLRNSLFVFFLRPAIFYSFFFFVVASKPSVVCTSLKNARATLHASPAILIKKICCSFTDVPHSAVLYLSTQSNCGGFFFSLSQSLTSSMHLVAPWVDDKKINFSNSQKFEHNLFKWVHKIWCQEGRKK